MHNRSRVNKVARSSNMYQQLLRFPGSNQLSLLCIIVCISMICTVAELPSAYQGRFVDPEAMGVQMMKLTGVLVVFVQANCSHLASHIFPHTGPLTLNNGSTISLTTVTYFKALHSHERPHQFDVRYARVLSPTCKYFVPAPENHSVYQHRSQTFFLNPYDPEEIQYNAFDFPLYFATPTLLLKELAFQPTISLVSLQHDTEVPLPRTHLYTASWHHRVLNDTTQEIRYAVDRW